MENYSVHQDLTADSEALNRYWEHLPMTSPVEEVLTSLMEVEPEPANDTEAALRMALM